MVSWTPEETGLLALVIYFETGGGVPPPRWFVEGAGLVFLLTFILNGLEARPVQLKSVPVVRMAN